MTIAEKRESIQNFCYYLTNCEECPIKKYKDDFCYAPELPDEIIERNFKIISDYMEREADSTEKTTYPIEDKADPIKPNYYNDTKISPIDVIEDWDLDFCLGSALKYIKRAGKKDNNPSIQDLKKVQWYVERRIQELERETIEEVLVRT